MSTKVRLEFKSEGFRKILRSQAAVAMCMDHATPLANQANANGDCEGFEAKASVGANRARAAVIATDRESRRAEASDKALTRALGGA